MTAKFIRLSLLSIFTTILSSCDEKLCGCTVIDIDTHIVITDDQHRNLLNPTTPGYFKKKTFEFIS